MTHTAGRKVGGRDEAIDVVRALCIISMTFAHLAIGSVGYEITHVAIWFDGAMGFVLLSGLVVGLVYRRIIAKGGISAGQIKVLRRARLIYLCHILLCVIAFAMVELFPSRAERLASIDSEGGWWGAIWRTATLNINPPNASILSLYAILLVLTAGGFWLLNRGMWHVLLGLTTALYVAGHLMRDTFTFSRRVGEDASLNWATWQTLFFGALVVGWYWSTPKLQTFIHTRWLLVTAAVATLVLATLGRAHVKFGVFDGTALEGPVYNVFDGSNLGPGTIAMAFVVTFVLYRLAQQLVAGAPAVAGPVAVVGRRSLDCYMVLSVIVIVDPLEAPSWATNLYPLAVLALMFGWCSLRDSRDRRGMSPIDGANLR